MGTRPSQSALLGQKTSFADYFPLVSYPLVLKLLVLALQQWLPDTTEASTESFHHGLNYYAARMNT